MAGQIQISYRLQERTFTSFYPNFRVCMDKKDRAAEMAIAIKKQRLA